MEKLFEENQFHGEAKFFGSVVFDAVSSLSIESLIHIGQYHAWNFWDYDLPFGVSITTESTVPLGAIGFFIDDMTTNTPVTTLRNIMKIGQTASTTAVSGINTQQVNDLLLGFDVADRLTMDFYQFYAKVNQNGSNSVGDIYAFITSLLFNGWEDGSGDVALYYGNYVGGVSIANSATGRVGDYFAFYSNDAGLGSYVTGDVFHFYGKGDYPSFFGGEIQQTEKDITASTPPTQAEMVSALGVASAHPDASLMVKVTDGSHFRVFSDGTSWFYSAYTVGA
jgi:hypothetical protein